MLWHSPPASFGKKSSKLLMNSTGLHLLMDAVMITGNYYLCCHMECMCIVSKEPYLLVYCESALEVYNVIITKWINYPIQKSESKSTTKFLTNTCFSSHESMSNYLIFLKLLFGSFMYIYIRGLQLQLCIFKSLCFHSSMSCLLMVFSPCAVPMMIPLLSSTSRKRWMKVHEFICTHVFTFTPIHTAAPDVI